MKKSKRVLINGSHKVIAIKSLSGWILLELNVNLSAFETPKTILFKIFWNFRKNLAFQSWNYRNRISTRILRTSNASAYILVKKVKFVFRVLAKSGILDSPEVRFSAENVWDDCSTLRRARNISRPPLNRENFSLSDASLHFGLCWRGFWPLQYLHKWIRNAVFSHFYNHF